MGGIRANPEAASPLTVILTIALVAAGLTAVLFFAFVDVAGRQLSLERVTENGAVAFRVTAVHSSQQWSDLEVRFVTPGGTDQAGFYLDVPSGAVHAGDVIHLRSQPPSGTYLLEVRHTGVTEARVAAPF